MKSGALGAAALMLGIAPPLAAGEPGSCTREIVVLGAGQDAGAPQIGQPGDEGPSLTPSAIALIDLHSGQRFVFDATPALGAQLAMLDRVAPPAPGSAARLGIDGIFLTHAHIGHYLGLGWLGREAANTSGVPVFAMPRMAAFLRGNGPWSQLVETGNIALHELDPASALTLSPALSVRQILVPHRDEFSETVGFVVTTPGRSALYLPDLDSWDQLAEASGETLESLLAQVDYALVDATFWDDGELGGRDMSAIPHPRVRAVMDRLQHLPAGERGKVHFIHYNHTNPIRDPQSPQSLAVEARGFHVARAGLRLCLAAGGD